MKTEPNLFAKTFEVSLEEGIFLLSGRNISCSGNDSVASAPNCSETKTVQKLGNYGNQIRRGAMHFLETVLMVGEFNMSRGQEGDGLGTGPIRSPS